MYRHTQIGYSALIISAVVWIVIWSIQFVAAGDDSSPGAAFTANAAFIFASVVLAVVAVVFSTMTITVTGDSVEWNLSLGLFKQRIPRSSIRSSGIIGISLLNGIGIRTNNFRDFLWCVGGSSAVRFELENGSVLALGTDDPNGLLRALNTDS